MEDSLKTTFIRKFAPLVVFVSLFIMTAIPLTYYLLAKNDLRSRASTYAEQVSNGIKGGSNKDVSFLKTDAQAIVWFFQDYFSPSGLEKITAFDAEGTVLATSNDNKVKLNTIHAVFPLYYNNQEMGTIRVDLSGQTLKDKTLILGLFSLGSGFIIGYWLLSWPVRVLRKAEEELVNQVQEKAHAIAVADTERNRSHELEKVNADLTTTKRKTEELVKQLDEKNKEMETFVYTVSHDLKSPVVGIQGMAGILLEDYQEKLDKNGRHCLHRLTVNADHMEHLIQDLLDLSRIGRAYQPSEMVDLKDILDEFILHSRIQFPDRKIDIRILSLPSLITEKVHIQRVFENLLTNACKFLGDQAHPQIEVGANDGEEIITFWIKDNGIGIDPAYHENIFGIFHRLQDVEVEGTGVGLTIVKRIVEQKKGKIWVDSRKGNGSTFYFTWPRNSNWRNHGSK